MHKNDNVTELLSLLLKVIDFDRVRLYIFSPIRKIAILKYVLTKNCISNEYSDEWEPLKEIPLNFRGLFKGNNWDGKSFTDFVLGFNEDDGFVIDFDKIQGFPDSVKGFHKSKNINKIAVCKLSKSKNEFVGYLAVDKSLREDQSILKTDLQKLKDVMRYLSGSIMNSLEKYEREFQIKQYYVLVENLLKNIDLQMDHSELMSFLINSILEICENIDVIQIKGLIPNAPEEFNLLEIKVNKRSKIGAEVKKSIESIKGKRFKFGTDDYWVTKKAIDTMEAVFIQNMKEEENYGKNSSSFSEDDPRWYLVRRNMCEINIPLVFGNKVYGVIDAHGKRPYSLNDNTLFLLKDLAAWITLILKAKEYHLNINMKSLQQKIITLSRVGDTSNDIQRTKHSELKRLYNVDDINLAVNNAIYQNIVYTHSVYKNKITINKISRAGAWSVFGVSAFSLVAYFFSGVVLINPFFAILGAAGAPVLGAMSTVLEKKNIDKSNKYNNLISDYTNVN